MALEASQNANKMLQEQMAKMKEAYDKCREDVGETLFNIHEIWLKHFNFEENVDENRVWIVYFDINFVF